jgi:hypothetical protein
MTIKIFASSFIAATIALATLVGPATPTSASVLDQAPKPPTDARRVAYQSRKGKLNFGPEITDLILPTKVKDFDYVASFTNPGLQKWRYGFTFRKLAEDRFYAMVIFSDGYTGMFIQRPDKSEPLKAPAFSPAVKKNAGEANEVAVYARNNQALLFINKTYVDTFDIGEHNDYGELALWAEDWAESPTSGTLDYKNLVVRAPASTPAQAYKPPASNQVGVAPPSNILLSAYRFGSEQHGRPQGMDTPEAGCGGFDDSRPVKSVQAALKIENKSNKPLEKWYAFFVKSDGKAAYTCFYTLPVVPPNDVRDVTFQAFVELNETVEYIIVIDDVVGKSNRIPVPQQ